MSRVWAGRILSAIPVLFVLMGAVIKLMKTPAVVQIFAQFGFQESLILVIGLIELGCVIVYLIPRTAVLGAILMTALLGGATVTNVRLNNPDWVVPVLLGVLVWGGLFLRDERVRMLIPFRKLD
ncbi:MAG: DoxX family protein [Gemmatimonadaceae bacterium]